MVEETIEVPKDVADSIEIEQNGNEVTVSWSDEQIVWVFVDNGGAERFVKPKDDFDIVRNEEGRVTESGEFEFCANTKRTAKRSRDLNDMCYNSDEYSNGFVFDEMRVEKRVIE
jgi:hypothetical protein